MLRSSRSVNIFENLHTFACQQRMGSMSRSGYSRWNHSSAPFTRNVRMWSFVASSIT